MDSLIHFRTFLAVAKCEGFSDAARQLHVVPSVVAKRISQLEDSLQTRLFERTTRHVALTESGQRLLSRAPALIAGFDDVLSDMRSNSNPQDGEVEGHIRVMSPTTLTLLYLGPVFDSFLAAHDRVTLEISLVDRSINPVEEGFDVAISGRSASYDGVIDVPLCPANPIACAAPAYLKRSAALTHPRDLAEHACLVFKPSGTHWVFNSARGPAHVDVVPRLMADDNLSLLHSAIQGRGIAVLPAYVCGAALASGDLQVVLPDFPPVQNWFKAYVPRRRHGLPRVQALLQWLSSHMANLDGAPAPNLTPVMPPKTPITTQPRASRRRPRA